MICRLRLDLFHVIPQIETSTCGLASSQASTLFKLLFFAVALMFHTHFTEKGLPDVRAAVISLLWLYSMTSLWFSVCVCMHAHMRVHRLAI